MKRVLIISDTHCGHKAGLTTPSFNPSTDDFYSKRTELWNWFETQILRIGKPDILVCNGDMVDGNAKKNGGVELLTTDRSKQTDMAQEIVKLINAKTTLFTEGTEYHVGKSESWDNELAKRFGSTAKNILNFKVNGVGFNVRHHTNGSSTLNNRSNSVIQEARWDILQNEADGFEPHIWVRGHVHYYNLFEDVVGTKTRTYITSPALQLPATNYGERRCRGGVNVGFLLFNIYDNGDYGISKYMFFSQQKKDVIVL